MLKKWFFGFISLSILAFVGRITGFFREIIMASSFGAGSLTDSYLTTVILFDIAIAANSAIISSAHSYLANSSIDQSSFVIFLKRFSLLSLIFLCLLTVLLIPIIDWIVPIIFSSSTEHLTIISASTKLFLFTFSFVLANGFLTVILQQKGIISIPGGLTISLNISSISFLIFAGNYLGIISIPFGFLLGGIVFYLIQLFMLNEKESLNHHTVKFSSKPMLYATAFIFFNLLLPNIVAFFERIVALPLTKGVFSHYAYAGKLILLPLTILGYAISTSLIPLQSKLIKEDDIESFRKVTDSGILISLIVSGVLVVLFAVLSDPIVKIIFERGKFLSDDTLATASTLRMFSPALFSFLLLPIISNIYYSLGLTKKLLAIGLASVILNIILLFIFVPAIKSSSSIALASMLSNLLNVFATVYYLHTSKKYFLSSDLRKKIMVILMVSAVFSILGMFLNHLLEGTFFFSTDGLISSLFQLIVGATIICAAYALVIFAVFRNELKNGFAQIFKRN